jgi:hypothetical protein
MRDGVDLPRHCDRLRLAGQHRGVARQLVAAKVGKGKGLHAATGRLGGMSHSFSLLSSIFLAGGPRPTTEIQYEARMPGTLSLPHPCFCGKSGRPRASAQSLAFVGELMTQYTSAVSLNLLTFMPLTSAFRAVLQFPALMPLFIQGLSVFFSVRCNQSCEV